MLFRCQLRINLDAVSEPAWLFWELHKNRYLGEGKSFRAKFQQARLCFAVEVPLPGDLKSAGLKILVQQEPEPAGNPRHAAGDVHLFL